MAWGLSSTIHGFPGLSKVNNLVLRVMWVISIMGAIGYCIYLIYGSVLNFLEFNVITQTTIEYQANLEFPTVTFCNENPFNTNSDYFSCVRI